MPVTAFPKIRVNVFDGFYTRQFVGQYNFGMHFGDKHVFIVRTVENSDSPSFGQATIDTPEIIVLQFLGRRLLERKYLASLRIDTGHDVFDCPVFSGCVHSLKNNKNRIAILGVEHALQFGKFLYVFSQLTFSILFG